MANTTFNGPVRSENGFKNVIKSSTTGGLTSEMTLSVYTATVTVANGDTTGKESSIGIPSNFIPMAVNSTGFKGFFPCNGVLGMSGGTTTASTATAEATEIVVSGDPGGDTDIVMKFIGISSSSDDS